MNRDHDIGREPTDEDYKWATQDMNKDKDIVEAFGGCWHESTFQTMNRKTPGGKRWQDKAFICDKCGKRHAVNPDFTTDAGKVQLLKEMRKRVDWHLFVHEIGKCNSGHFYSDYVEIDYITDTAGKFRDATWKWLCGGKT